MTLSPVQFLKVVFFFSTATYDDGVPTDNVGLQREREKGFKRDVNLRMHARGHNIAAVLAKPDKGFRSDPELIKRRACCDKLHL